MKKGIEEIVAANVEREKAERQEAAKHVKDQELEAIVEYFANVVGIQRVVESFGVDYNTLLLDTINGLLCILYDANKQWEESPCDTEGATKEQEKLMDEILMNTACDIICFFKNENINYLTTEL